MPAGARVCDHSPGVSVFWPSDDLAKECSPNPRYAKDRASCSAFFRGAKPFLDAPPQPREPAGSPDLVNTSKHRRGHYAKKRYRIC